ncbi:MAG: HAD family hydrolase [Clostridiales bacterium]|nr:HAD family hydrolase [Clostridiales bacterium]
MVKYIFLDIDGTLLGKGGRVPASAVDAVQTAQKRGNKVFLCTGRSKGEIPKQVWEMGFDGIVGSAGAYVEAEGRVLFHRPMSGEMVKRLMECLKEWDAYYAMETNEKAWMTKEHFEKVNKKFENMDIWEDEVRKEFLESFGVCKSVLEMEGVNKCIYYECTASIEEMQEKLPEFTILPSSIENSGKNNGEISEKGMSKAKGIEVLQQYYHIERSDIICFGDGLNDMEMIEFAGIGVAMENGAEELKKIADYVTDHVDENGLSKGFCKLGLIG